MKQLNGLDSLFVYNERPATPMTMSMVGLYDSATAANGRVSFQTILDRFAANLSQASLFRQRLIMVPGGLDRPYWVADPHVNVSHHVQETALPAPGNWQQLHTLLEQLQAEPLDMSRPPWDAYVIRGLNDLDGVAPGGFALFARVHHAAADGMAGLAAFLGLHSPCPKRMADANAVPALTHAQHPDAARLAWYAAKNYGALAMRSGKIASDSLKTLIRVREGLKSGQIHHIRDKAVTRFNSTPSGGRVVGRYVIDYTQCREVRKLVPGATLNDVMLTVIAGGLRRYLSSRGELPASPLVAGCPVNVRRKHNRYAEENLISLMNVSLCTDIEDPVNRLKAVQAESAAAKEYQRRLGPQWLNHAAEWLPPFVLNTALNGLLRLNKFLPGTHHTLVSNLHGLRVPMYFAGAQLVDGFALGPPLPHCNLFHTILGINERVSISFNACRTALPDRDHYLACLDQAWQELQDCLVIDQPQPLPETTEREDPPMDVPQTANGARHSVAF